MPHNSPKVKKHKVQEQGIFIKFIIMVVVSSVIAVVLYYLQTSDNAGFIGITLKAGGIFAGLLVFFLIWKSYQRLSQNINFEEMKRENEFIKSVLNQMPVGVMTYDTDLRASYLNKKYMEFTGLNKEQVLGLTPELIAAKIYVSNNIKPIVCELHSMNKSSIKNRILPIKHKSGKIVKLKFDGYKLKDQGYLVLISEAKKEQELENLQLQTQTILDSVDNLVLLTDKNEKIIMCNNKISQQSGLTKEVIIGQDLEEFLQKLKIKVKELKNTSEKELENYEIIYRTVDDKVKVAVVHTASICNVDQETIGKIFVASDITSFKMDQEKIKQQEKLAIIGQMAAGVVHEIRNPLTSIKGFSQLINHITSDKRIKEYVGVIESEANNLNNFITEFLLFTKPRDPVFKYISIREIIDSMYIMLDNQAFMKRIKLEIVYDEEDRVIKVDENQIKQVILNIVQNAFDALLERENPKVIIRTGYVSDSNEVFIAISDNGVGMSQFEIARLGSPFFTTKETGTGLGLSVCYQIVKEHGGRIVVESMNNKGTTFVIYLPCARTRE
ncbi:ATP-binding protein [Desulfitibacter alkalitolerans]|uniref:ATP-binding protein n=1 Tax=Desulfitibacter alkalitolerans TaxID=264641 RepID=UPI0006890BB7|nr:ATP-binding protein [Desulfitibacter alkalitolerans]